MRDKFIQWLIEKTSNDKRYYLIIADVGFGIVEPYENKFPDHFINVGVAEQHALGLAAGLADAGNKVYFYGIAPFITYRCMDQIRMFMSYMKQPITLVGNGKGKKYEHAGFSHWAINDWEIMQLMGVNVETPETVEELYTALENTNNLPQYIRL